MRDRRSNETCLDSGEGRDVEYRSEVVRLLGLGLRCDVCVGGAVVGEVNVKSGIGRPCEVMMGVR